MATDEFTELRSELSHVSDGELKHILSDEWENYDGDEPLSPQKLESLYAGISIAKAQSKRRFSLNRYWMQIAASVLVIVVGGLAALTFHQNQYIKRLAHENIVFTSGDYGCSTVTLPDGTVVRLNSKSTLAYAQNFGRENRDVRLSGEAFFEVAKDDAKKFVVDAGQVAVTVHGTKFNVHAYENKDFVEMALVEGSVSIKSKQPPYENIQVKPNEKVVYDKKTGSMSLMKTNNETETAWMTKELVFRSDKLIDVFNRLSRKFAVSFEVENDLLLNDVYSGVFDDENIESIMKVLKIHYGFNYVRNDDTIYIYDK